MHLIESRTILLTLVQSKTSSLKVKLPTFFKQKMRPNLRTKGFLPAQYLPTGPYPHITKQGIVRLETSQSLSKSYTVLRPSRCVYREPRKVVDVNVKRALACWVFGWRRRTIYRSFGKNSENFKIVRPSRYVHRASPKPFFGKRFWFHPVYA